MVIKYIKYLHYKQHHESQHVRKDYVKRLRDFELDPDPDNDHVFSPGYLLARYLQARHFKKKIFLVGKKEQSISEELDEVGISSVWSEDSNESIKSGKVWSLKNFFFVDFRGSLLKGAF